MTARQRIALVGCGKEKLPVAAPAGDLYTGALFTKARAYARRRCDGWAILSAKHGLVLPDTVIEPYDVRMPSDRDGRKWWARRVNDQVFDQWCRGGLYSIEQPCALSTTGVHHPIKWNREHESVPIFIVLAGAEYRIAFEGEFVDSGFCHDFVFDVPMRGLGIGEQLHWLNGELGIQEDTA